MNTSRDGEPIDTIYGRYDREAKHRLDLTYDYESAEIQAFCRIADAIGATLMLDVGANIGVYAIFLQKVESLARILAFEPAPSTFDLLERNVALQDSARIECRNVALSSSAGKARFSVFGDLAGNNAIESTAVASRADPERTIRVATARLDDQVRAKGETFMCKIDVEGHELSVLDGATEFLTSNTGVLQIESFSTTADVEAFLAGQGYQRIFRIKHDYYFTNLSDSSQRDSITDILFDEVARALTDLKEERRLRRRAIRSARENLNVVRFGVDPVSGRSSGKRARKGSKRRR